jgi:hypothetical protein
MRILKRVFTAVLATVTLFAFFYLTTIVLSFIYDMDEALLTF